MFRKVVATFAALGLVMAMAGSAYATDLNPDHVGAEWADFLGDDLTDCTAAVLEEQGVEEGEVLWHFVLTGTDATSGNLTATFSNAGEITVANADSPSTTLHFFIVTDEDNVLESASTDVTGNNLNLSHTCFGGPPPEIPEAPFAVILPLIALAALGGYLLINRRKATSVV